jgi:predicted DNA-binding transcriptional regulator AlpA
MTTKPTDKTRAKAEAKARAFAPGKRLLRRPQVLAKMGIGKTKLYDDYVATGRLPATHLSPRVVVYLEEHVDRLIDEIIDEAAAKSAA